MTMRSSPPLLAEGWGEFIGTDLWPARLGEQATNLFQL
jgi:hypothetical protein